MKTIVVANPKGGAGKTTLAINLGVAAHRDQRTCLVDMDVQGTLAKWHRRRMEAMPDSTLHRLAPGTHTQLRESLTNLARGDSMDLVLIDTRPGLSVELNALVHLADLVLIPCRPSLADVEAVLPLVRECKASSTPFTFVLNSVRAGAKGTAQTVAVLSKHGAVDENFLGDRTIFMDCLPAGLAPGEIHRKHKASQEVDALFLSVHETLEAQYG